MACSWYDLDQHEVLDLKGRILEAAGASKKHGQTAKYPLHAGSYTSAVVDLNSPSWTETLINAGETAEETHEDCTCCQCEPRTPPRLCSFQAYLKRKSGHEHCFMNKYSCIFGCRFQARGANSLASGRSAQLPYRGAK